MIYIDTQGEGHVMTEAEIATSQGMPMIDSDHQTLRKSRKGSTQSLRRYQPFILDF